MTRDDTSDTDRRRFSGRPETPRPETLHPETLHPETLAVHAGRAPDPVSGAVTPAIHLSTTFERAPDGTFPGGFSYAREDNPNRRALEACVAALEGGAAAFAFGSGMAATTALIEALPGDRPRRIVMPTDMYYGNRSLIAETDIGRRFAIAPVEMTDPGALAAACAEAPTGLVWLESPSNPLITVTDIARASEIAHAAGALVAVDNTWATPVLQRPFDLGADLIMHAATKYIGGHSDLMTGLAIVKEDGPYLTSLKAIQHHKGAIPSPFECWLALRGVQTLSVRVAAQCRTAQAIAAFLAAAKGVDRVHFPGLPGHPGHAIAAAQMRDFGAMLSFEVTGGAQAAFALTANLKLITRATSLGGTHSLIEHRASIEGPSTQAPPGLLRLSVGLEHPEDLIGDLAAALQRLEPAS